MARRGRGEAPPPTARGATLRRSLRYLLPGCALLAALVVVIDARNRSAEAQLLRQQGRHAVELQSTALERALDGVRSDLRYLADQGILRRFLDDPAARAALEAEYRAFARARGHYLQLRLLDLEGHEQVRVEAAGDDARAVPASERQAKAGRYYFKRAVGLPPGEIYTSPFDLNVERGAVEVPWRPVVRVATPVFAEDGTRRGVLVLNFAGGALLRSLTRLTAQIPGRTFLVDGAGYYLEGPDPDRSWGFMFDGPPTFAADHARAWAQMRAADRGQGETDAGLYTFATLQAGALDLRVVSVMPAAVLAARADRSLARLIGVSLAAAALLLALSLRVARGDLVRARDAEQRAAMADRMQRLSAQLLRAQESERRSLARDLHDELGQTVTAISLQLQRARKTRDPERHDALLENALSGTERLLATVHSIVDRLRPDVLDDVGLGDAVANLVRDYQRDTGITVQTTVDLDGVVLPTEVRGHTYRIVQEALSNVAEHAGTDTAWLSLGCRSGVLELVVRDAGRGFDATVPSERFGLLGMRERVTLMGGEIRVETRPGEGTRIEVRVPCPPVPTET